MLRYRCPSRRAAGEWCSNSNFQVPGRFAVAEGFVLFVECPERKIGESELSSTSRWMVVWHALAIGSVSLVSRCSVGW
jgi:hypothetical protein